MSGQSLFLFKLLDSFDLEGSQKHTFTYKYNYQEDKRETIILIDMAKEEGGGEEIVGSMSEGRSFSSPRRSWATESFHEAVSGESDAFHTCEKEIDEEEELKWEALRRLPTYDRMRKGILKQVLENGNVNYEEVDITKLGVQEKKHLLESILRTAEEDNESFLNRMRERIDRCLPFSVFFVCVMFKLDSSKCFHHLLVFELLWFGIHCFC